MANREQKYNYEDILSEIKSRKLREKTGMAAPVEAAPEPEPRLEPKPEPAPVPQAEQPTPEPKPKPQPVTRHEPKMRRSVEDFEFRMPELGGEKPKNPLDYNGDAPDISERAKVRGGLRGTLAQQATSVEDVKIFGEKTLSDPPQTAGEISVVPDPAEFGSTRVLPDMTVMREQPRTAVKPRSELAKQSRLNKFALGPEDDYYFDPGDKADDIPEGSVIDYSEYNSISDRRDVQRDIAKVKLWLFIRAALTLVLTGALLVISLAGKYPIPLPKLMFPEFAETVRTYFIVATALTILVAVVNSSAVGGGLMALFKMHANSDTLAACAILAAVGQGVAIVADPTAVNPTELSFYFAVAALAMLFNALGKLTMISRILTNFRLLATKEPKKAVVAAESDEFCREFFKDLLRKPVIAHAVKAEFFTDFLGLSYSDKYDVGVNRAVAPVCLAGGLAVCGLTFLLTGNSLSALSAFTAILCVCATLSSTFIENIPLARLTKKLAPEGGMVSGCKAVEDFCDAKAVVLTDTDLFPKGHVKLQGIKAFSQSRLDEAITDAASVLCAMDGTLGPVFLEMIGGNKKLLKKVDNIVLENAMGVSAWVDSRRVLVGNRRLMQNHGITLPPEALQAARLSTESEPLFVSNSGEASAMFTVSYHADDSLAAELDTLVRKGSLLIVNTSDANVTAEKIEELYGYPIELLRILPSDWHTRYKEEIAAPRDKAVAKVVYAGNKAVTMVKAIIACAAARSSILAATVIQLIQIVLGYSIITFMAFMGSISSINIELFCVYQLFWFIAISIIQQLRQS
jgi:cation transport ATPase